jgi:hypothetical protein
LTGNWNMGYPTLGPPTEESEVAEYVSGPVAPETMSSADADTQAAVTEQLEALAPQGAVVARDAADLASLRTAEAAEAARRTKALAVAASASAIADAAARTAVAAQLQADASAVPAADAAAHAARVGAWARLQIPARRSGLRPTQEAASKEGPGNAMGVQRGRGVE